MSPRSSAEVAPGHARVGALKRRRPVAGGLAEDDLPEPLSDEELIRSYRAGCAAAGNSLLTRYQRITWHKVRSYFLVGADEDDLLQEGMIGLYKAMRDFNPDRHASFRTFAVLCITRQIITAIRATQRHKHLPLNSSVSLSRPPRYGNDSDSAPLTALASSRITDPADTIVSKEELRQVRATLSEILSDFEAEVLHQLAQGYTYQEIADHLGRQAKSIDNAMQRVKRKVKEHLSARGCVPRSLIA